MPPNRRLARVLAYAEEHLDEILRRQAIRAGRVPYDALTAEDRQYLFRWQGRRCAVCGRDGRSLRVDYDQASRAVRGLLCRQCDLALALFNDDLESVSAAQRYLKHAPDGERE